jgi:hypothetical protein
VGQQKASGEIEEAQTTTGAVDWQWLGRRSIGPPYLHLRRHHGWQIELFFKELKSTLGFHQYRFRQFERVEGWDELLQVTFLYLEWYRARQLQRRDLPEEKKKWWRWQRTHGLCLAVRQAAEVADLEAIAERLETPTGLQRLRRLFKRALPKEAKVA